MSQNTKNKPVHKNVSYTGCQDIVRAHDPDRYLMSLMMPRKHRRALWALFAFNYEIAKTREVVTETTIGLIRLQWWRDAIKEIYDGNAPRLHEVVTPLAEVIKKYDLPLEHFETLIYAREFDLEGVAPANIEGLLNYCDFTNTPLSQLCLKILSQTEDDRIVKRVSQYYGVIGTLRAVPYMLKYGQVMIPQDILTENNLSAQKINDFNKKDGLVEIVRELVKLEVGVLSELRNDELLMKSRFIHTLQEIAKLYAYRIERFNGDVFAPQFHAPMPTLPLRLWMKGLFR